MMDMKNILITGISGQDGVFLASEIFETFWTPANELSIDKIKRKLN